MKNDQASAPGKKMGRFRAFFWLVVFTLSVVAGLSWYCWESRTTWPHFPSDPVAGKPATADQQAAAANPDPEVVVEVDHDYGYRIGDVIPVTIFLKEKPGTEIDLHSMAIEGDFEIVGDPTIFERRTANGVRRLRADVKLQSFSPAPKLTLKANLSYRVKATNDDKTVSLPAFEAYTSNTWDGRDRIEEGHLAFKPGFEPWLTALIAFGGLGLAIYFFVLGRRYGREKPVKFDLKRLPHRFQLARRDFNLLWALMEAGDRSADRYAEMSQLLRRLYKVETKTTLETSYFLLYSYNGPLQVTEILQACDRVIYRGEVLDEADHQAIKTTFDYLVPQCDQATLDKLPPTRVVLASAEIKARKS